VTDNELIFIAQEPEAAMSHHTIDTALAKRLVEAQTIRGAAIVGQPGGWSVMLKLGVTEKPLGTQRTDQPRLWRSLDKCVQYLKDELRILRVDLLDATQHSPAPTGSRVRLDTAERMRRAHEAAEHDRWFRAQVQAALDDPRPAIPHDEVMADLAATLDRLADGRRAD
jgi:hypothetical protein